MTDTERLLEAKWILERQLAWIAAAEVKVGIVTTIDIAMLAGLGALYTGAAHKTGWVIGIAVAFAVLAVVALFCAAVAISPRLQGPSKSMLYFGAIAAGASADYATDFKQARAGDLLSDLLAQIHRNAEVARDKHTWVGRAVMVSFLAALPWIAAVVMISR
jgi:hypothetical protein